MDNVKHWREQLQPRYGENNNMLLYPRDRNDYSRVEYGRSKFRLCPMTLRIPRLKISRLL